MTFILFYLACMSFLQSFLGVFGTNLTLEQKTVFRFKNECKRIFTWTHNTRRAVSDNLECRFNLGERTEDL